jgi:diguanylate cyclase (GGDEF)-like protein
MLELHHLYATLFAIAAGVAFALAAATWRHRATRGARGLMLLTVGVTIWAGASAGAWSVHALAEQVLWLKVIYLGMWMIPVGFLTLALDVARMDRWLTTGRIAVIAFPPILLTILVWANPAHSYHKAFTAVEVGPFTRHVPVPGPLYWTFVAVGFSMVVFGIVILARVLWRSSGAERNRTAILLWGASVPILASIVSEFRLVSLHGLDPTPLAFLGTSVLWMYGLSRGGLLDILPLARHALVDQMSDGVIVLDDLNRIADANPAALSMLGSSGTAPIGQPAEALFDGAEGAVAADGSVTGGAHIVSQVAVPSGCSDDCRYVDFMVTALDLGHRRPPAHLIVLHDVTEEREQKHLLATAYADLERSHELIVASNERLQEQTTRDPLTRLYNRRYLEDRLPGEMARTKRDGTSVAFLFLDIDDFKLINDNHSHSMGDACLTLLSELLLGGARGGDIVCRFGGDEFLVVMLNAGTHAAVARAERLRRDVADTRAVLGDDECAFTVSIGVSSVPANGFTAEDGIAAADSALRRAKASGRNGVAVASDQKGSWPLAVNGIVLPT